MTAKTTNLMLRNDTILGVCEAIGQDFGFNPNAVVTPAPGPKVYAMDPDQVMLTADQISAVVEYERSL